MSTMIFRHVIGPHSTGLSPSVVFFDTFFFFLIFFDSFTVNLNQMWVPLVSPTGFDIVLTNKKRILFFFDRKIKKGFDNGNVAICR